VPQRASSMHKLQILRREAHQILSDGAGASYREIFAKPAEWYSANMKVLLCRPGRLWRGVVPYGRSLGRLTWNEFLPMSMPTKAIECLGASAIAGSLSLVLRASNRLLVGQEHGRTIPLADSERRWPST
jgi:hypothetical protein